eukprot:1348193-Rhodomonas_salina.1
MSVLFHLFCVRKGADFDRRHRWVGGEARRDVEHERVADLVGREQPHWLLDLNGDLIDANHDVGGEEGAEDDGDGTKLHAAESERDTREPEDEHPR